MFDSKRKWANNSKLCALSLVALIASSGLITGAASASTKPHTAPLVNVTIAYSAPAAPQAVVWVADDNGYFAKYGINATVEEVSSPAQAAALKAGDIDFSVNAAENDVASIVAGSQTQMIALLVPDLSWYFYTAPAITKGSQLVGKIIADQPGTPANFADLEGLKKLKIPSTSVSFENLTSSPAEVASALAGQVQGIAVATPDNVTMGQHGWNLLVNEVKLHLLYPSLSVAAESSYLQEHSTIALDVMKAMSAAIAAIDKNPSIAGAAYAKWSGNTNPSADKAVGLDDRQLVAKIPAYTTKDAIAAIDEISPAPSISPSSVYNDTFVDKLIKTGFYHRLKY